MTIDLRYGDTIEQMKFKPDKSIDFICCDLPYGTTNDGYRFPSTVQFFQQKWRRQGQLHSTQKPVELIEWLINPYSNENDTILDNTFGSCTTGIACINTNRNFIGIENNIDYFNISLNRVNEKRKEKEFNLI